MALTNLWASRRNADQIIKYVCNPEKTTEPEGQGSPEAADGEERRYYVTGINCREETAAKQFMETKEYWSRVTGQNKFLGRSYLHGYQSFKEGETDAETAHEIGVKLATKIWGDSFEVIVATHCNTKCYQRIYFKGKEER